MRRTGKGVLPGERGEILGSRQNGEGKNRGKRRAESNAKRSIAAKTVATRRMSLTKSRKNPEDERERLEERRYQTASRKSEIAPAL